MSHNTLVHHIVRPAVRLAAQTAVTPNQLTTVRLLTCLLAAAAFAQGLYGWLMVGGLLFLLSTLLDRADGELARQTNRISAAGHRYDLASDCAANVVCFLGLGIGAALTEGPVGVWLGLIAALGICSLFFELNVLKIAPVRGHKLFGGRINVDPDDAMIFVPILIWCGLAWPMLLFVAVITPMGSVGLALLGFYRGIRRIKAKCPIIDDLDSVANLRRGV